MRFHKGRAHIVDMTEKHQAARRRHITLPENKRGRDFIVADIHGYRSKLDEALESVSFNPATDRLISVGDIIDRGPDSPACLALLDEPWFWMTLGNHEQMFLEALADPSDANWSRWLVNGGSWVLQTSEAEQKFWQQQLEQLPLTITLACLDQTIGVCHAEYTSAQWQDRQQADDQEAQSWLWGRSRLKIENAARIAGVDWVFSGHTVVQDTQVLGNQVFIERGAYLEAPLNLIDLQQWCANR